MQFAEISYSEALAVSKVPCGGFHAPDGTVMKVWAVKGKAHLIFEFKDKCYKASYIPELNEFMQLLNPVEDNSEKDKDNTGSDT